jgi:outer membrane protein OmpA-like peptidoglycan-associated protein
LTGVAVVAGHRVVVGHGTTTVAAGRNLRRVGVRVALTTRGRALTARPGGVRIAFTAAVSLRGHTGTLSTHATTTVLAKRFRLARSVRFSTDSDTVGPADTRYLKSVRGKLTAAKVITCVGHADSRGSAKDALALGNHRAKAACAILAHGLHAKIHTASRGEKAPTGKNNTDAGRARNRRVDITISN